MIRLRRRHLGLLVHVGCLGSWPAASPAEEGHELQLLPAPGRAEADCTPTLQAIVVEGNQRTRDEVILRELRCRVGDPLADIDRGRIEARLRNLNLFSDVTVAMESTPDSCAMTLAISVRERPAIWPFPIAEQSDESGISGGGGLAHRNFRGWNERLEVKGELGGIRGCTLRTLGSPATISRWPSRPAIVWCTIGSTASTRRPSAWGSAPALT